MKTAKDFANYILKDDATEYGGTSHSNETLKEFMEENEMPLNTPMEKVNEMLKECGIEPINSKYTPIDVKNAVLSTMLDMFDNNNLHRCGQEDFINWCENGGVFYLMPNYDKFGDEWAEECCNLMCDVAPLIDILSYKYFDVDNQ